MTSCLSNRTDKPKPETVILYPKLYFPKYPDPKGKVKPLDENGKIVKDNETEIVNVIMPLWYYKLILEYKLDVDTARVEYERFINAN